MITLIGICVGCTPCLCLCCGPTSYPLEEHGEHERPIQRVETQAPTPKTTVGRATQQAKSLTGEGIQQCRAIMDDVLNMAAPGLRFTIPCRGHNPPTRHCTRYRCSQASKLHRLNEARDKRALRDRVDELQRICNAKLNHSNNLMRQRVLRNHTFTKPRRSNRKFYKGRHIDRGGRIMPKKNPESELAHLRCKLHTKHCKLSKMRPHVKELLELDLPSNEPEMLAMLDEMGAEIRKEEERKYEEAILDFKAWPVLKDKPFQKPPSRTAKRRDQHSRQGCKPKRRCQPQWHPDSDDEAPPQQVNLSRRKEGTGQSTSFAGND